MSLISTSTRRQPARRSPPASRLCLEALEDRCLLTFSPAVNFPAAAHVAEVVTADFNGDGRLDFATTSGSDVSVVSVLLGNAAGTFQPPLTSAGGHYPQSLVAGDFNGDGKIDLASANANDEVSLRLGNGDGTFQSPSNVGLYGLSLVSLAVADFNADGKDELVQAGNRLVGSDEYGNGYIEPSVLVLAGTATAPLTSGHMLPLSSGYWGYGRWIPVKVADFNGDGKQDIAAGVFEDNSVVVVVSTASGFAAPRHVVAGGSMLLAAADVSGDGKADLVTANFYEGRVAVQLSTGQGTFGAAQYLALDSIPSSVAVADFNLDGKADLLTAAYGSGMVGVLLGTGAGAFLPPTTSAISISTGVVAVGDFNRDGRPDAAGKAGPNVSVLLNDGVWPALNTPTIAITDVTVGEGNLGTVSATFTVRLSAASAQTVSVHYATADDSATVADGDFQAAAGTVTFAPGETSQTLTVLVNSDRLGEPNESFLVRLSAPTNALIADATGIGTILDDEPTLLIGWVEAPEGNTGATAFTFLVTLSEAYDVSLAINYSTRDFAPVEEDYYGLTSATAGVDYVAASGTLTISAGQTSGTIIVLVSGDRLAEAPEYFLVSVSSPSVQLGSNEAWGTILNDDLPPPSVLINDVAVTEGNTGTRAATFIVSLSHSSDQPVTVAYATTNSSASAGSDFQAASSTLTIPAGQTTGTITVLVNGDRIGEANETFFVNLSNPTNATLADGQGLGTILDDEPRISINDAIATEGNTGARNATFTMSLSAAYDLAVTVRLATANGSAAAGSDYTAASGNLTIAAGQTAKTFTVAIIGDRIGESNETFFVNLSSPTNATLADGQGEGIIMDDEPRISISDASKNEGKKNQTTLFTFKVTLSAPYDQAVTMSFSTMNGTAKSSDSDYIARTGTLTFAPGETTKTITIEVPGDSKKEADETFYLDLFGNSGNALFAKKRGLGTILNDD